MSADGFETLRQVMVSNQLRTVAVDDPRVIAALRDVPREAFVPVERRAMAYADLAIPLGQGRLLNTPMATARLINAAGILPGERVLIVGAATGYSAALAVHLGAQVTALESDPALAAKLEANVPMATVVHDPLEAGVPGSVLFDVIIVDGAVEALPQALVDQLAPDGRLATGLVDGGVTRLALGRKGGSGFGAQAFADTDVVVLPGFARPRAFVFPS